MESWQELLRKRSIASLEALVARFGAEHFPDLERLRQAAENFEFRISPAMVELIMSPGDPIWRQYVPDLQELEVHDGLVDSLAEDAHSPVPNITHRYPDRVPFHLPERITPALCAILKQYHPLYINTHFNHPDELTPAAVDALGQLADVGIPLGCQTVLLKGVNDDTEVMKRLMQRLLAARVRPYYIYMCDQVAGAEHFRTTVEKGLEIIRALRGWTSGLAVPHFVIDAPGGGARSRSCPSTWSRSATRRSCSRTTRGSGTSTGSPPRARAFSSGNTLTSRVRRHHIYCSDHIGAPRGPDFIPRYRRAVHPRAVVCRALRAGVRRPAPHDAGRTRGADTECHAAARRHRVPPRGR